MNAQNSCERQLSSMMTASSEALCRPLPTYLYGNDAVYQLEREHIFAKNWLYVGQLDRLAKTGDYLSVTLAGYPIFVYRSPVTKELVAFHNVCSHRAGPIVPIDARVTLYGNQSLLKCQYHAWLYDSRDGALKATPHFNHSFTSEEKRCLSLKKVHLETFAGQFLFVNLNTSTENIPIGSLLKDLSQDMMAFPLDEYRHLESQQHLINCNWKTYVENYQEGYHIHSVHPELNRAVQFKQYRVTNKNNLYSIHHAPSRSSQSDQEAFLWVYIYPNLAINLYEKGYSVEHILPVGKGQTMLSYHFFVRSSPDLRGAADRAAEAKESMLRTLAVTNEDKLICEQVQQNLDAGIYRPGFLSPSMENGVAFFQGRIRTDLQGTHLKLE